MEVELRDYKCGSKVNDGLEEMFELKAAGRLQYETFLSKMRKTLDLVHASRNPMNLLIRSDTIFVNLFGTIMDILVKCGHDGILKYEGPGSEEHYASYRKGLIVVLYQFLLANRIRYTAQCAQLCVDFIDFYSDLHCCSQNLDEIEDDVLIHTFYKLYQYYHMKEEQLETNCIYLEIPKAQIGPILESISYLIFILIRGFGRCLSMQYINQTMSIASEQMCDSNTNVRVTALRILTTCMKQRPILLESPTIHKVTLFTIRLLHSDYEVSSDGDEAFGQFLDVAFTENKIGSTILQVLSRDILEALGKNLTSFRRVKPSRKKVGAIFVNMSNLYQQNLGTAEILQKYLKPLHEWLDQKDYSIHNKEEFDRAFHMIDLCLLIHSMLDQEIIIHRINIWLKKVLQISVNDDWLTELFVLLRETKLEKVLWGIEKNLLQINEYLKSKTSNNSGKKGQCIVHENYLQLLSEVSWKSGTDLKKIFRSGFTRCIGVQYMPNFAALNLTNNTGRKTYISSNLDMMSSALKTLVEDRAYANAVAEEVPSHFLCCWVDMCWLWCHPHYQAHHDNIPKCFHTDVKRVDLIQRRLMFKGFIDPILDVIDLLIEESDPDHHCAKLRMLLPMAWCRLMPLAENLRLRENKARLQEHIEKFLSAEPKDLKREFCDNIHLIANKAYLADQDDEEGLFYILYGHRTAKSCARRDENVATALRMFFKDWEYRLMENQDDDIFIRMVASMATVSWGQARVFCITTLLRLFVEKQGDWELLVLIKRRCKFIAKECGFKDTQELFEDLKDGIHAWIISKCPDWPEDMFYHLAASFYRHQSEALFLEGLIKSILEKFEDERETKYGALKKMCARLDKKPSDVVQPHLNKIITSLLFNSIINQETSEKCLGDFIAIMKLEETPHGLIEKNVKPVIFELMFYLGNGRDMDQENARRALEIVREAVQKSQSSMEIEGVKDLADFIAKYTQQLLDRYASIILSDKEQAQKRRAIRSMKALFAMIGAQCGKFAAKIMTLLKKCLELENLSTWTMDLWKVFVLQLDNSDLKNYMAQITVIILDYLRPEREHQSWSATQLDFEEEVEISDTDSNDGSNYGMSASLTQYHHTEPAEDTPNRVKDILEYMICDNLEHTKSNFDQLPMFPDEEELDRVKTTVENHLGRPTFTRKIEQLTKVLKHQNEQVQKAAVKSLVDLIRSNRKDFSRWLDDPRCERKIREILLNLFRLTKSKDKEMTLLLSELLGEIGAINLNVTSDIVRTHKEFDDQTKLIINVMNKFLKGAVESAPDTRIQKKIQYVIQELLKLLDCTERSVKRRNTNGHTNWRQLKPGWDVFEPCLKSSYQAVEHQTKRRKLKRLSNIFAQHKWQSEWFNKLIGLCGESSKRPIYELCALLAYSHPGLAEFLLPDLVFDVIQNDCDSMVHEVSVIFQNLSHDGSTQLSSAGSNRSYQMIREKEAQCQIVFKIIDVLNHWRYKQREFKKKELARHIDNFMEALDLQTMADAALKCHSYARAFQYQEKWVESKTSPPGASDITRYQNIVAKLREFSFLDIVSDWVSGYDLQLNALTFKFQGQWIDSMNCYYALVGENSGAIESHEGLLDCYLRVGQYVPIVNHVTMKDDARLNGYAMKACWRLYRWDALDEYCASKDETEESLDVRFGRCMAALQNRDQAQFDLKMEECRIAVMKSLSVACMDSYERTYPYLVELHCLQELGCAAKLIFNEDVSNLSMGKSTNNEFFWKERLQRTQDSFEVKENILSTRRAIFKLANLTVDEAGCWLNLMHESLDKEQTQMASFAFMKCKGSQARSAHFKLNLDVAGAKLEWMRGNVRKAIQSLRGILGDQQRSMDINESISLRLLLTKWWQDSGEISKDLIENELKGICKGARDLGLIHQQEEPYFQYATFLDNMTVSTAKTISETVDLNDDKEDTVRFEGYRIPKTKFQESVVKNLLLAINCYGYSLAKGNAHVFQSLPRMLKLHFQYGESLATNPEKPKRRSGSSKNSNNVKTTKYDLNRTFKSVPTYCLFSAVSQIVARATDKRQYVSGVVDYLIVRIFENYPSEAIWKLAIYLLSKKERDAQRKYACQRVCKLLQNKNEKIFTQGQKLMNALDDYVIASAAKKSTTKLWAKVTRQKQLDLVIPIQSQIEPCIPTSGINEDTETYDPFASSIKIHEFCDSPKVMPSLARPSKVKCRGTDGRKYAFLLKQEDSGDLRKESRVMEFCAVVNRVLQTNPDAKRRNLGIRTFSVVTWRGKAGMIEWMENTCTLRNVLREQFGDSKKFDKRTTGDGTILAKYQMSYMNRGESEKKKLALNFKEIDDNFPKLMQSWFMVNWPDCEHWFRTRLLYTTSLAVWSMVGMILGLGDRHTENILMDVSTGQICHVDFDCIFDKAQTLKVPEQVPFRLTSNLRKGLGICDHKGPFRQTCVVTLTALRKQKEALKTVLDAFINDPLSGDDYQDLYAKLTTATQRLEGYVPTKNLKREKDAKPYKVPKIDPCSSPLTPEGQTDSLIALATDPELLSKMFRGWMPFV